MRFARIGVVVGLAVPLALVGIAHGASTVKYKPVVVRSGSHVCTKTLINGINDAGEAVGTAYCGRPELFTRTKSGHIATYRLPAADGAYTEASNIASDGTIALIGSKTAAGHPTSYLMSPAGVLTRVRDPAAKGHGTIVDGVNSHGFAVGGYCVNAKCTRERPFLYSNGKFTDIGKKSGADLQLSAVTDSGQVAGFFYDSKGVAHGIVIINNKVHDVDGPRAGTGQGQGTLILNMSNNGSLCGDTIDNAGRIRGFVKFHGHMRLIDPHPGAKKASSEVLGINNHGEIGGHAVGPAHRYYVGFIGKV